MRYGRCVLASPSGAGRQERPALGGRGCRTSLHATHRKPLIVAISWRVDLPADIGLPMNPCDTHELVENVLENACKWAAYTVRVRAGKAERGSVASLQTTDRGRTRRTCARAS